MGTRNSISLIGDVHGKTERYLAVVRALTGPSIQLGDMGLGDSFLAPPAGADLPALNGHRFLRGNHDSPQLCREHPNYLGEYGFQDTTGIFWVSGAFSVDRERRLASHAWWADEELSEQQWERLLADYERSRPVVVISHECPSSINTRMLDSVTPRPIRGFDREVYIREKRLCSQSRTCLRMEEMLRIHRPRQWVFAHYHVSWEERVDKTYFTCLAELEAREFNL